jgi:predicted NBD/HSP70 family sugar kinase
MRAAKRAKKSGPVELDTRQRGILRLLWRGGRMSRWELHRRTGVNPNAVGVDVATLLNEGILRECQSEVAGPGRPRIPLEIDPSVRHVVGLAISPGRVEAGGLSLRGNMIGRPLSRSLSDPSKTISAAAALLRETMNEQTLAVGLSVTGFVDPIQRVILLSSSFVGQGGLSLQPLYDVAGDRPIILENNLHALAAWWLLVHQAESDEDVMLVSIGDGQMGAALLIEGRPNRGCATGANELGHMRFFVDTEVCYCGHPGCLERVCSTEFLRRRGVAKGTLFDLASRYGVDGERSNGNGAAADKVMGEILDYLAAGIANAVNFIRPNRLVITSELTRYPAFMDALMRAIRSRLVQELVKRVRIDQWDQADSHSAETAGWLALASLYREGWSDRTPAPEVANGAAAGAAATTAEAPPASR